MELCETLIYYLKENNDTLEITSSLSLFHQGLEYDLKLVIIVMKSNDYKSFL